jgi:Leucine-rich repeat (LRR) protein
LLSINRNLKNSIQIATVFIVLVAGILPNIQAECEDYSPCACGQDADGNLYVNCIDVMPLDIQAAFSRTTALDIYSLVIILPAAGGTIPADLLAGKRALIMDLLGTSRDSFQLIMDPAAIRSSSSYTKQLVISKCDLSLLNFDFLRGFTRLEELRLDTTSNVKPIENLPPLTSLVGLAIDNSQGFDDLINFPARAFSSLDHLYFYNDGLSDQAVDIVLNAFVSSTSASTLTTLTLSKNQITRVPSQIVSLPNVINFALTNNNISIVNTGALSLTAPKKIYLNNVSLDTIEPNAFQG